MQLTYDTDLVEGAVFLEARRLESNGQGALAARYDRARTRLYSIIDPDLRHQAFYAIHLEWFRNFGLEDHIRRVLSEFPMILRQATVLLLRKAVSKKDEGAELFVRSDARNVAVALRGERFLEPGLDQFLRHELCHIADMLDPAFGYEPNLSLPDAPPTELNLLRDRYRVLWDITIDGRLHHHDAWDLRRAEFNKTFSHLSERRRDELFNRLWTESRPTHAELVAFAKAVRIQARNVPGAICPLCRFPTFEWAGDKTLGAAVVAGIQVHFPGWAREHGCCARCAELYSLNPLEQPATLYV